MRRRCWWISARQLPARLALAGLGGLAACQALPPAMSNALVGFGQDVLAAAATNFAPQYAASMENLFLAMAETATGMPFTQPVNGAANANAPGFDGTGYGQEPYHQGSNDAGPYGDQASYEQTPYDQDPYAQTPYDQAPYEQTPEHTSYHPSTGNGGPAGIALDVALLAQERLPDGQVRLRPVQDGDVLHDGRGNPDAGDKIKIFFSTNCACHVYVIGIDATGYVANIFPDGATYTTSRVTPGAQYLVPGGSMWWGLDQYRGVEQIYFIASHQRRLDIERTVAQLAGRRPELPANYRPVREPAIVATARGLMQVQSAAPTMVATELGGGQQVSPTSFQSTVADADLVITRWFTHE